MALVEQLELKKPETQLFNSYMEFIGEMHAAGDKVWEGILPKIGETAEQFAARLRRDESEPAPGLVAQTTYWAVIGDQVVGRIAMRHCLNENLKGFGGHIGYEVHPSFRRQGIAKEMLKRLLETPKAREIGRLLLTCDPTNIGSNKTILANGGRLEKTAYVEKWQRQTNYYWITV